MSIGNGAPAWPSVIVSNGGISPSDHSVLPTGTLPATKEPCRPCDNGTPRPLLPRLHTVAPIRNAFVPEIIIALFSPSLFLMSTHKSMNRTIYAAE